MIRAFFFLMILGIGCAYAAKAPDDADGTEYGIDLRIFKKIADRSTIMGEIKRRHELHGSRYQLESIGLYHRVLDNLKAGLFYWHERGNRWNQDWINPGSGWQWANTNRDDEHSVVLDLTPGWESAQWPLTLEWKNRLVSNLTEGMHFLRTRPGLNYFFFKGDVPMANIFIQHEWYLPLDYGRHTVYERWAYLGALFHLHSHFQLGPYYARRVRHWSNEDSFTAITREGYFTRQATHFIGLTVNFTF